MALEDDYKILFDTLHRIVDQRPDQVPQLLALILSGGPFRPALDKPESMNKIISLAKGYVAKKKAEAKGAQPAVGAKTVSAPRPAAMAESASAAKRPAGPPRTVSAADLAPPRGPAKA